jgi:4-hydroxybenzoate polyprenyltransferase
MKKYIKLMRPYQYIKNILIFTPLFFTFNYDLYRIIDVFIVFLIFSILASSIYVFNDIVDKDLDAKHPKKKSRPIASGEITSKNAYIFHLILILISFSSSFYFNQNLFKILLLYYFMNILYTTTLKKIPIVDVIILSIGFVLRLFEGESVIEEELSFWIIIMTYLLAILISLAKRRGDINLNHDDIHTRINIDKINIKFIDLSITLMAAVTIVAYINYTVSISIIEKFNTENLYISTVFVLLGVLRYMQITFVFNESDDPSKVFLSDKFTIINLIMWIISFYIIVNYL